MSDVPLRIVHLNSLLTGGGTDDQCVKLVRGLCQLEQRAVLLGPNDRDYSRVARDQQIPFHPSRSEGPLKLCFIWEAARFIRTSQIQIVHGHHGRDIWPTILAARLSGRKPLVVLTRHLAKSPSSWASRRLLLGQCDGLIAVSQFVGKVLREGVYEQNSPEPERRSRPPLRGEFSKIRVIYPGIDTNRFKPAAADELRKSWGINQSDFVFAVVGGYDSPRGKGQREFLRAAAQIHSTLPHARFLIVGRGNLKDQLERDIRELGLEGKAWLTPYCRDMPSAMNALDCLVHPQVGTEAFGAVLLEAFACGKSVVASALDGISEAFAAGQHGRLVAAEDVSALSQAMLEEARRPALSFAEREALHDQVARNYSLEVLAGKVLAYYRQLMSELRQRV